MKHIVFLIYFFAAIVLWADTIPSTNVKARVYGGDGVNPATVSASGDLSVSVKSSTNIPVTVTNNPTTINVTASAPLPVTGVVFPTTQDVNVVNSVAVTGPITNSQLRSAPVITNSLTNAELRSVPLTITGSVLTGGLTNSELRASPLAVTVSGAGDATAANQVIANNNLTDINQKLPFHLTVIDNYLKVDNTDHIQPVVGNVVISNSSLAVTGPLTNAELRQTAVPVTAIVTNSVLPTGAATLSEQQAQTTKLTSIDTKLTSQATASLQSSGNVSLASIDSKTPAQGQALAANSSPVVLPASQIATLTPQTDALTNTQLRATPVVVAVATSGLPTGASTLGEQQTQTTKLTSIDNKLTAPLVIRNLSSSTDSTTAIVTSSVLPAGAATETTLAAINTKIPASPAQEHTTAGSPTSNRLSDGTTFYDARQIRSLSSSSDSVAATITSSALPSGAATAALQTSGNASLTSIDGKVSTAALQTTGNNSLASIDSKLTAPLNIRALSSSTDSTSAIVTSSALPAGGSTSALQTTGNSSLSSIDTKLTSQATAANQTTGNNSLSSIDGKLTTIASNTSGSATAANQSTEITQLQAVNTKLAGTLSVSVTSSALPTGAATSAIQASSDATLSAINSKITAVNTGAVVVSSSALPTGAATEATLASLNSKVTAVNTGAVTVASSALPTGGSTSALQTSGNASLISIDSKLTSPLAVNAKLLDAGGTAVGTSGNPIYTAGTSIRTPLTANTPVNFVAGVTSAQAVAANASRKGLVITNSSAGAISFGIGTTAIAGAGITLYPGGTWYMDAYSFSTAAINVISSLAGSNISIQELQ